MASLQVRLSQFCHNSTEGVWWIDGSECFCGVGYAGENCTQSWYELGHVSPALYYHVASSALLNVFVFVYSILLLIMLQRQKVTWKSPTKKMMILVSTAMFLRFFWLMFDPYSIKRNSPLPEELESFIFELVTALLFAGVIVLLQYWLDLVSKAKKLFLQATLQKVGVALYIFFAEYILFQIIFFIIRFTISEERGAEWIVYRNLHIAGHIFVMLIVIPFCYNKLRKVLDVPEEFAENSPQVILLNKARKYVVLSWIVLFIAFLVLVPYSVVFLVDKKKFTEVSFFLTMNEFLRKLEVGVALSLCIVINSDIREIWSRIVHPNQKSSGTRSTSISSTIFSKSSNVVSEKV